MYCLEYRGYEGKVKTQYSELANADTEFYKEGDENYFFIPHNMYIIGTMNTIDRSVESFDFALRRRFTWKKVEPDYEVLKEDFEKHNVQYSNVAENLKKINKKITEDPLLGEDYQIGHAYCMKLDKYKGFTENQYLKIIWEKHISPILEEYYRGTDEVQNKLKTLKNTFISIPKKKKTETQDAK